MKLLIKQFPPTSSLFGPNILLSTLFSDTFKVCSSLNVRDQGDFRGIVTKINELINNVDIQWNFSNTSDG
jgi:hypothetical protein